MYPKLHHLINDILGIKISLPIQTFGFFVALAFGIGSYYLYSELKRKEIQGILKPFYEEQIINPPFNIFDWLGGIFISFFIGFKVIYGLFNYATCSYNPAKFITSGDGSWMWGAITLLLYIAYKTYNWYQDRGKETSKRLIKVMPSERTSDLTLMAALGGIIGAKIFHLLEYPDQIAPFLKNPLSEDSFSGLTMYGGLILGAALVIFYAKTKKIGIRNLADSAAPALMLAYGIGRLGCHFSGDGDWGIVNTKSNPGLPNWLWSYTYPNNVNNQGVEMPDCDMHYWETKCSQLPEGVWPTSVYEFFMCTILFFVIMMLRKRFDVKGMVFSIYLILNGIERFAIESIRVNTKMNFAGISFTQAQLISTLLILLGILGIYFSKKMKEKEDNNINTSEENLEQTLQN